MFRLDRQLSSPPNERQPATSSATQSPAGNGHRFNRHSVELSAYNESPKNETTATPSSAVRPTPLQSSYSMNDIPTMRNAGSFMSQVTPTKNNASQQFHNHNASLGRIPPNAIPARRSREMSISSPTTELAHEEQPNALVSIQSNLQPTAAPFGPQLASTVGSNGVSLAPVASPTNYNNPSFYGYGLFGMGQMGNGPSNDNGSQMYHSQHAYPVYQPFPVFSRHDSQSQPRPAQSRRNQPGEGTSF